jgi:hypothetical protein
MVAQELFALDIENQLATPEQPAELSSQTHTHSTQEFGGISLLLQDHLQLLTHPCNLLIILPLVAVGAAVQPQAQVEQLVEVGVQVDLLPLSKLPQQLQLLYLKLILGILVLL